MGLGDGFDAILDAARAGGEAALTVIYREYHPRVVRFIRAKMPGDAEDLAGDVWVDVASGLPRFQGDEDAFGAWLFTIARRRVVDAIRKSARRRTSAVPVESMHNRPADTDVEAQVLSGIGFDAALALVRELSPDQADVVLLRVVAGLEVDEVAAILGKRPGTIRVLQHRALRRLAKEAKRTPVTPAVTERLEGQDATPTP